MHQQSLHFLCIKLVQHNNDIISNLYFISYREYKQGQGVVSSELQLRHFSRSISVFTMGQNQKLNCL
jgi:hypothetical protein